MAGPRPGHPRLSCRRRDDTGFLVGALDGEALIAAMQASPHRDIDVEPKRTPMPVRKVSLAGYSAC
jgi:hypothetical protein